MSITSAEQFDNNDKRYGMFYCAIASGGGWGGGCSIGVLGLL